MIGPSTKSHQWWQKINMILLGFAVLMIFYIPYCAIWLSVVVLISGVVEARFDKREVNWRT